MCSVCAERFPYLFHTTEMEAHSLTIETLMEPPKLLRRPLPPKVLPSLNEQRPKTSRNEDKMDGQQKPTPAAALLHSHDLPSNPHNPVLRSHNQAEPSGLSSFPKRSHKKPPVKIPPLDDFYSEPPSTPVTLSGLIRQTVLLPNTGTLSKPVLSHTHYNNIENYIAKILNEKQSQLTSVLLSPWDIPEVARRIPEQQRILELQLEMSSLGERKITGPVNQLVRSQYCQGSDPMYDDTGQGQLQQMLVSRSNFAVLESLVHGGSILNLKAFFISKLPDLTPLYNTLVYLNLSFNDLRHFPKEVYKLEHLEVLKLRNNPLKEIPFGIHSLKKLRSFIMSFCLLSSLPEGLFQLSCLQVLDVSYNSISSISSNISNLRVLEFLNVEGNNLPALPCGALKLQLRCLRVRNNAMHPLFWRENSHIGPQRLTDLAAAFLARSNLFHQLNHIPSEGKQILENSRVCDCCRGSLYGEGLLFIRPCEKIFGVRKLPFMFRACSPTCYKAFMSQTETLVEQLYER
uniref:Leucine rich repeat containing 63 n=1 Tax=Xenopus tropicalis TaxID=8364 RepID=A0A803JDH7_XENTR